MDKWKEEMLHLGKWKKNIMNENTFKVMDNQMNTN